MIRIGSRGSKLALAQTRWVMQRLSLQCPGTEIELRLVRTVADIDATMSLRSTGSTGVFVKELEEAMLAGEIDLAVHSMKDLPTRLPDGLVVAAVPEREDPRDAIVARVTPGGVRDLPAASIVGTGSPRRAAQLLAARPDLQIRDIRGNVDTRLAKLDCGEYDAIVLACAGLNRMGLSGRISSVLEVDSMLPAPGQGALALEAREDDAALRERLAPLHHPPTGVAVTAEREVLRRMGGGCNTPIGVHAAFAGELLRIDAIACLPDGTQAVRAGIACAPEGAGQAAAALAESMLAKASTSLLAFLR